jgi:hypothetical protein
MFGGQNNYVAPVAPAIVPTNNLILYLNANSYTGNGVAWNDNSTQNNNATLVGSPTYTSSPASFTFGPNKIATTTKNNVALSVVMTSIIYNPNNNNLYCLSTNIVEVYECVTFTLVTTISLGGSNFSQVLSEVTPSNEIYYFDDISQSLKADELGIPMNFESSTLTYGFFNFDGGNASVVANPSKTGSNTSNKVGKMVKGPGGQPWGGSFIELASPIDFSAGKTIKLSNA